MALKRISLSLSNTNLIGKLLLLPTKMSHKVCSCVPMVGRAWPQIRAPVQRDGLVLIAESLCVSRATMNQT